MGVDFGFGIGVTKLGVDFGFRIDVDRRRSEIKVVMWVWADDQVTEEEDLVVGGKSLFLQLGFWVEVTNLGEDCNTPTQLNN